MFNYQTLRQTLSIIQNLLIIQDSQTSKTIKKLMKTYHNNNKKYNSELFDVLSIKLLIFYDAYAKLGLDRY
jgi:hypothetical protein